MYSDGDLVSSFCFSSTFLLLSSFFVFFEITSGVVLAFFVAVAVIVSFALDVDVDDECKILH